MATNSLIPVVALVVWMPPPTGDNAQNAEGMFVLAKLKAAGFADVQVVTSHEWQPLMLSVKIKAVRAQQSCV